MKRALRHISKVLPYFATGFALFFVIGFVAGWDTRAEHVRERIYRGLMLGHDNDGYVLIHRCNGARTHGFYVGQDKLVPEWSERIGTFAALGHLSARHLAHRELVLSLIGGASAGITWRDISKVRAAGTSRWLFAARVVAGIVGGVTGYSLGYYSGSHFASGCDSDLARELLSDVGEWRRFEQSWIIFGLTELSFDDRPRFWNGPFKNLDPLQDDPVFLCKTSLRAAVLKMRNAVQADGWNPGDKEFASLQALKGRYEVVSASPAYARVRKLRLAKVAADRGSPSGLLKRGFGYTAEAWADACRRLEAAIPVVAPLQVGTESNR